MGNIIITGQLKDYLNSICKIPLLTLEEEKHLLLLISQGDKNAKKDLIEHNLRLCAKNAFSYSKEPSLVLELIQEGNLGLIETVSSFNLDKNVRFSTYATYNIRKYMIDYLYKNQIEIPATIPRYRIYEINQYKNKKQELLKEMCKENLTLEETSIGLNLPKEKVLMYEKILKPTIRFDETVNGIKDDDNICYKDIIIDQNEESVESVIASKIENEEINQFATDFADKLTDFQRNVFFEMIYTREDITAAELSQKYNVSSQMVSDTRKKVLRKARIYAHKKGIKEKYWDE